MLESDAALEMWGGIECTVNRVGNRYNDQLELNGHAHRTNDIALCASLGVKVLRYPLLWERLAPGDLDQIDWTWADERMRLIRDAGITPIVGLLHHGSGPRHTSLLDDEFSSRFAAYARRVAERYPWIRFVTPVNEPLTTARFSGLYGVWYPHAKSADAFATACLNQIKGIQCALRTMREVIPDLELVQTEDLARIYATPTLQYQADFENDRRWLTFDALCGRLNRDHPMWRHLATSQRNERLLDQIVEQPTAPSIIGINYYPTSDRLLDDRLELHPPEAHGGNGRHRYADVEAVRAHPEGISGHAAILEECWERYRIPLAITEAHLGCTREQQMRWLKDAWQGALTAQKKGCDVRAVTAWALFGSFGWDNLVTRRPFKYECGAFDVRSDPPRETALAEIIRSFATKGRSVHPAAESPGWWRVAGALKSPLQAWSSSHPLLVTGARGTLGRAFVDACQSRGIHVVGLSRDQLDVTNRVAVWQALESIRPWAVVNAAGYVRVDDAERECYECRRVNVDGPRHLAEACAARRIPFMTFSTDLVFDGAQSSPYTEENSVNPLNVYGQSKADSETRVLSQYDDALIIRTSSFFAPRDEYNFVTRVLRSLLAGIPVAAADDAIVSPTYVPDLADGALDLLIDKERGIWHLTNQGETSWANLAVNAAQRAGCDPSLVNAVPMSTFGRPARVPEYSALRSKRGTILPTLDDALDRYFNEFNAGEMRKEAWQQLQG